MAFSAAIDLSDTIQANRIFSEATEEERFELANKPTRILPPIFHILNDHPSSLSLLKKMAMYTDINVRDRLMGTPLLRAILLRKTKTVRLLVDLGADINLPYEGGKLPIHISAQSGKKKIFERILSKKPSFDAHTLAPDAGCEYCRSPCGHTVHCFIYDTVKPKIARLALDYIIDSQHPIDNVTVARYFQLFASHGDVEYLERVLSHFEVDPSNFIFTKFRRTFIPGRAVAEFMAKRNLLTPEYADWNIREAAMSNDVESVLLHIAHGATRRSVKIPNMTLRSNAVDIITILIATIGIDVSSSDIETVNDLRDESRNILENATRSLSQRLFMEEMKEWLPKSCRTHGDVHTTRIQIVEDIKKVLHVSLLWRDDDGLPELADMVDLELQKEVWRKRIQELK